MTRLRLRPLLFISISLANVQALSAINGLPSGGVSGVFMCKCSTTLSADISRKHVKQSPVIAMRKATTSPAYVRSLKSETAYATRMNFAPRLGLPILARSLPSVTHSAQVSPLQCPIYGPRSSSSIGAFVAAASGSGAVATVIQTDIAGSTPTVFTTTKSSSS